MAKVPAEVLQDARNRADHYCQVAQKITDQARDMLARAEALRDSARDLRNMADRWEQQFPGDPQVTPQ